MNTEQTFLRQARIVIVNDAILSAKEILTFSALTLHYRRQYGREKAVFQSIDNYLSPIAQRAGDAILDLLSQLNRVELDVDTIEDLITIALYGYGNEAKWKKVNTKLEKMKEISIRKGISFSLPNFILGDTPDKPLGRTFTFSTKEEIEARINALLEQERIAKERERQEYHQRLIDNFDELSPSQQEMAKAILAN